MTSSSLPVGPRARRRALHLLVFAVVATVGCGDRGRSSGANSAEASAKATAEAPAPPKRITAPHGGLLIPLGDQVAQLELVVDSTRGIVTIYVYDGAARQPLRLTQGRIDLTMLDLIEGVPEVGTVMAGKANASTGDTFDNTSVFIGFVPQLTGRGHFRGRVQRIEVNGQVFTDIPVTYPAAAHT